MATKQEHLLRLNHDEERACREFAGERIDELIDDLAEARAERDEAREELRSHKDAAQINSEENSEVIRCLRAERAALRDALAKLKAAPPVAEASIGGVTEEMLDRLGNIFARHGLSREMEKPIDEWMKAARAARRAQKRVDVEAIREVARSMIDQGFTGFGRRLLWAIEGKPEPGMFQVSAPAAPPPSP